MGKTISIPMIIVIGAISATVAVDFVGSRILSVADELASNFGRVAIIMDSK